MAQKREYPTQLFNNNVYSAYNPDNDDADMSSSIMSFGEPHLDEISLQIALTASHLALDSDIQDDDHDDYDFVHDYEDVYMPDIVESFDAPNQDGVAWQVDLLAMNGAPNEIIRNNNGHPH
ncbi:hypothetical protein EC957_007978 [Mortierella hygrophila]|uniref:Uncharacterized protein n=1 Tax=Mortierella hygrophila TaxID=979708 RepID=A0A9P6JXS1_9FUNG|nr:hypothetical protein EC957_007978 [Mortierella hygrophila]